MDTYEVESEIVGFDDYVEEGECPCAGKCDADKCDCWDSCWVHA